MVESLEPSPMVLKSWQDAMMITRLTMCRTDARGRSGSQIRHSIREELLPKVKRLSTFHTYTCDSPGAGIGLKLLI
jgi:hypothetical protein